jgi:hypothetical protein
MKRNLTEEIYRMRKLMGYDSKSDRENITSLDRLTEEKIVKKYFLNEQYDEDEYLNDNQFKEEIRNATRIQNLYGNNIFTRSLGKPQPLEVDPPKVKALYKDNMVTIDGTTNSEQLKVQLDIVIQNLLDTPGFDAKNVEMSIQGAANNERPTGAGPGGIKLDHPDSQPFGGINIDKPENYDAGNQYLAEKRAESVAEYIEEKIPGITIKSSGKVMPGETEEEKFILLDAKYRDGFQYPIEQNKPKIEFSNNLSVKLGEEFGVEGGSLSQDPNQKYYQGKRTIKLTPAGGKEPIELSYFWDGSTGDNPISGPGVQGGVDGSEFRQGTWTDNPIGAFETNEFKNVSSNVDTKIVTALGTSGYLNNLQEGNEILKIIMDGTKLSGVSEINDFETFIKTLGIGNSNFDRDLAVDNGAFMINYITKIVSGGKKKS